MEADQSEQSIFSDERTLATIDSKVCEASFIRTISRWVRFAICFCNLPFWLLRATVTRFAWFLS